MSKMQESPINSLKMALIDIRSAVALKMPYLALIGTMSLIDICSALEDDNGQTDRYKFMAWFDKYLGHRYSWITGQDCYGIRCGLLHQGILKHDVRGLPQSRWTRIGFVLSPDGSWLQELGVDDHYFTGLAEFCLDVVEQVEAWAERSKDDAKFQENCAKLMHLHPRGVAPYVAGIPVLLS